MNADVRRGGVVTEGSLPRAIAHLAAPMLVTALLQNAQSLIDLFWVGSLGSVAVAAVAMSGTIMMILFPMLMGISMGTVAMVARAIGAGSTEEARAAAGQSLILAVTLGTLSGVAGWMLADPLMRLLGAEPDVRLAGEAYLRIALLGSFTAFALFMGNAALQGAGDALTPMWVMGIANVLNIVLDPLFIFGLGPVPAMGVRGAAIATVLAQACAASVSVSLLFTGRTRLHLRVAHLRPHPGLAWRLVRIGIPGSGQMLSRSLMGAVMMGIVATCGTTAVAAYGTGLRLHMIILMPAFALGGAAATLVGQNLGAGKPDRARRSAWLATVLDMAIMAVAASIVLAVAPQLIRAFNRDLDVVRIGAHYLRVVSPFYLFAAMAIVLGRAMQGAGDTLAPMIITIVSLWGLQVPIALLFARLWSPPTEGIWWAIALTTVIHGLLVAGWFETGRWKHKHV